MEIKGQKTTADIMESRSDAILDQWIEGVRQSEKVRSLDRQTEELMRRQSSELLKNLIKALRGAQATESGQPNLGEAADPLRSMSSSWAEMGFSPRETASYILTLKDVLLRHVHQGTEPGAASLNEEILVVNRMIDNLVVLTFETFVQRREEVITHQSRSLLELSTPVTKLWDGVLLLPLVGVVDTVRAQQIMEELLSSVVKYEARVVVLDISGVPIIDTRVALHLMKTVTAARMLGAEVIITGISPEAAQTIVTLDIDLGSVRTSGKLQAGMAEAFKMIGLRVTKEPTS